MNKKNIIKNGFWLAIALQVLDWQSSIAAMNHAKESNPAIQWLGQFVGLGPSITLFKLSSILVLWLIYRLYGNQSEVFNSKVLIVVLAILNVSFICAVFNNYLQ